MNQLSAEEQFSREIGTAIGTLAYFAAETGPQYWDFNYKEEDDTITHNIVIAISGSEEDIEAAIKFVNSIRERQMPKASPELSDDNFDSAISSIDIDG